MKRELSISMALLLMLTVAGEQAWAASVDVGRFSHSGDGQIRLISEKNGEAFEGSYRTSPGNYDTEALREIYRVFGAPYDSKRVNLSLRLIEFLDFLEDRLRPGALIIITSGYRHPAYNKRLRNRGALAAKASLHQYGMAADLKMEGVPAKRVWDTVRALGFGGAGYYQGETVHVDVGPARSWDEKTSGVGTGISDDNKLIGLVSDYDVYRPGEMVTLRFIRMTAFPIGVASEFSLNRQEGSGSGEETVSFKPSFAISAKGACPKFGDIEQMAGVHWQLPENLPPGRYAVRARFCDNSWEKMPAEVATPVFEVVR